jgi:hypothetical protein
MKICNTVLSEIFSSMPNVPPEVGGILGGTQGIVNQFVLDRGIDSGGCYYIPNVKFLNEIILSWQTNGDEFMGIFHSHFFGVCTLSSGDMNYILKIMQSMPIQINRLFFPILVMPDRIMIPYVAIRNGSKVQICRDKLIIQ